MSILTTFATCALALGALLPGGDDETLQEFKKFFRKYTTSAERVEAVLALDTVEDAGVVDVMLPLLSDADPLVAEAALRVLSSFTTVPPIERLVALMEAALRSMRGNRSSHTITFFDARGRLRTLEDAATWRAFADERRTIVAQEIERRLMA